MIDPGETADEANKMNLLQLCGSGWHTLPPEAYHRVPLTSAPSAGGAPSAPGPLGLAAGRACLRVAASRGVAAAGHCAAAASPSARSFCRPGTPVLPTLIYTYPYRYPAEYVPMDTGGGGGDGTVPTAPNTIWFQSTAKLQAFKGATSHANGM